MAENPATLALRCAQAMWAEDKASRGLGMRVDSVGPGTATLSMTIRESMVNGHGSCHGGFIFLLADSAFAFACNSYNQKNVAQNCQIAFIAPGFLGMRLIAEARQRRRGERSAIYDVTVKTDAGALIAEFRGFSRAVPGAVAQGEDMGASPPRRDPDA